MSKITQVVEAECQSHRTTIHTPFAAKFQSQPPMPTRWPILFFCFVLSGLSLDAYWTWHDYHFASVCFHSGNQAPTTEFAFTIVSLIPASASLPFRNNPNYLITCSGVWLFHAIGEISMATDWQRFEHTHACDPQIGIHTLISIIVTGFFSAIIVAISLAFGAAFVIRELFRIGKLLRNREP